MNSKEYNKIKNRREVLKNVRNSWFTGKNKGKSRKNKVKKEGFYLTLANNDSSR